MWKKQEERINKFEILNEQKQNKNVYMRGMKRSTRELCHQTKNKTLTLLLAYTSRLSDRIKSHFHHHQHHHPQTQAIRSRSFVFVYRVYGLRFSLTHTFESLVCAAVCECASMHILYFV